MKSKKVALEIIQQYSTDQLTNTECRPNFDKTVPSRRHTLHAHTHQRRGPVTHVSRFDVINDRFQPVTLVIYFVLILILLELIMEGPPAEADNTPVDAPEKTLVIHEVLDKDTLGYILSFLRVPQLFRVRRTCRAWDRLVTSGYCLRHVEFAWLLRGGVTDSMVLTVTKYGKNILSLNLEGEYMSIHRLIRDQAERISLIPD